MTPWQASQASVVKLYICWWCGATFAKVSAMQCSVQCQCVSSRISNSQSAQTAHITSEQCRYSLFTFHEIFLPKKIIQGVTNHELIILYQYNIYHMYLNSNKNFTHLDKLPDFRK